MPLGMTKHLVSLHDEQPAISRLAERIRTRREHLGLTQKQLGAQIGVGENAVTQYEAGNAVPRPKRFEKLAQALEVDVRWLLTGNEPDQVARAQTTSEQEALDIMRDIPTALHPVALAAIRGIAASAKGKSPHDKEN